MRKKEEGMDLEAGLVTVDLIRDNAGWEIDLYREAIAATHPNSTQLGLSTLTVDKEKGFCGGFCQSQLFIYLFIIVC